MAEEIGARSWELVATNKPSVVTEPFYDTVMVEDGQCDRGLPDSTWADESNRSKMFSEANDLLDDFFTPEKGLGWRRWQFAKRDPMVI